MVYLEHLLEVGIHSGHLWHASRDTFQDILTGVTFESQAKQEYGRNEKLGDKTSSTKFVVKITILATKLCPKG